MSNRDKRMFRRVVYASVIGGTIEWYDFFLYGVVAGIVFNKLYFPTSDPLVSTLLAYTGLAVGFAARPLGGLIFGHFGDRVGRKTMLIYTLVIMGGSTVGMGLVPTYEQIGIWAPIILLLLRVFQGIGLGGEWGGAVLMTFEYAKPSQRGLYASLPQTGASLGLLLASGIVALLSTLLSNTAFMSWGWRVPYIVSVVLVVLGLWIRKNVLETPEFESVKKEKAESRMPFVDMWKGYASSVMIDMGARWIDGVIFNIFGVFSIGYLTTVMKIPRTSALTGVMIAAIVMTFGLPFFGYLSDRLGRTLVYGWGSLIAGLSCFPAFWIMNNCSNIYLVWLAIIIPFGVFYSSVYGPQSSLFAELFDPRVRYTGISFVYQFSGIVAGGMTPIIATALLQWDNNHSTYICLYAASVGLISALSTLWLHARQVMRDRRAAVGYKADPAL